MGHSHVATEMIIAFTRVCHVPDLSHWITAGVVGRDDQEVGDGGDDSNRVQGDSALSSQFFLDGEQ